MVTISGNFSPLTEFGHVIQQVVMPIVAKVYDRLIPIGTGFVIAPDGLMMTAAHVLIEAEKHKIRKKSQMESFMITMKFMPCILVMNNMNNTTSIQ
ncbi:serine protease [Microcoleus sp. ZQ-A2]|nr:hypothetical protein [Microcoleus sp. FACHB-1]